MTRRVPQNPVDVGPPTDGLPTWQEAWMQVAMHMAEHGAELIGDMARDAQQDAVLPLQDQCDGQGLTAASEEVWGELGSVVASGDVSRLPQLVQRLRMVLNHARQCPSALPGIRQGILGLAQASLGNLFDPFEFAPSTAFPFRNCRAPRASSWAPSGHTQRIHSGSSPSWPRLSRIHGGDRRWHRGADVICCLSWCPLVLSASSLWTRYVMKDLLPITRRPAQLYAPHFPSWALQGCILLLYILYEWLSSFMYSLGKGSTFGLLSCAWDFRPPRPRVCTGFRPSIGPKTPPQVKAGFLIWLCLWPCHGVQIWQQGSIQGQPVFTTSNVQPVSGAQALQPVRAPGTPIVEPILRAGPRALRTICVYRSQGDVQPTVLLSDDRTHGALLSRMVCSVYGLSDSEWFLRRQVEALPSLPSEQYVLVPHALSWDYVQVPVDLRPLGGRIGLYVTNRCTSCGDIAQHAIQQQMLGPHPVFLCRTSQGWFHPSALLLLLPYGDAFQVWPMNQAAVSPVGPDDVEERPATLEDRFSTSLSLPSVGELAYHDLSGANAVVLHQHGHTYTCVPSYADHLTLRSAALEAVAADLQIQPRGRLCFARLLPPLDRMPASQFVAAYCADDDIMGVVDLRPSGGGVYVVQVPVGATPAERISRAVACHGDPDPASPLAANLAQGLLQVMHREHVVDPFASLTAAAPAPIVVLRRRSHAAAGYRDPHLHTAEAGLHVSEATVGVAAVDSDSAGSRRWGVGWISLGLVLAVTNPALASLSGFGVAVWLADNKGYATFLLAWLASPWLVRHEASAVQLPSDTTRSTSDRTHTTWADVSQFPDLGSVQEHAALAASLESLDARERLVPTQLGSARTTYRFCAWSPGDRLCFAVPGDLSSRTYKERLLEVRATLNPRLTSSSGAPAHGPMCSYGCCLARLSCCYACDRHW